MGSVNPLANDVDRSETATTDGQVGKLFAQCAASGFAIVFLVRGGEFFGLLRLNLAQ
jgi:hypothetical protein